MASEIANPKANEDAAARLCGSDDQIKGAFEFFLRALGTEEKALGALVRDAFVRGVHWRQTIEAK